MIIVTKVTLSISNSALPDDGDYTETCRSCFNVNFNIPFNLKEPCVLYIGGAYRYLPDVAFYIFFPTNMSTEYFKHAAHSSFFLLKMSFIS